MKWLQAGWRLLRGALLVLAALVVFIEEFGWRPLSALAAQIARWAPLARLEALVGRAPPKLALALFLVPTTLLFPIKIIALGLIQSGRPLLGVAVLVAAKVIGTALVGRLFVLLEPQLMEFERFQRAMTWWRETRDRIVAAVVQTALWRDLRSWLGSLRAQWRRWIGR